MKKIILIIALLILVAIGGRIFWAYKQVVTEDVFKAPSFSPSKEWSNEYVALFRQAIKEKYGVEEEVLSNNLFIIGVANGQDTDGAIISPPQKGGAVISYIYRIQWAYFSGSESRAAVRFLVEDTAGAPLNNKEIIENIKQNLSPIFSIKNIISEKEAEKKCGTLNAQKLSTLLKPPFYNNGENNINFDSSRNDLFFECRETVNYRENQCSQTIFSLATGSELFSRETACYTTPSRL